MFPVLGSTWLSELTPVRLNLLYAHLLAKGRVRGGGGLSPKTVQNVHRMLHRALRDAVRWDVLPRNVPEDADPPRGLRPEITVWSPTQRRAFIRHVEADRFGALWLLICTTGLRRGELAGLRLQDVDLVHGLVTPRRPRVVVDGHTVESEPKTAQGFRSVALDPVSLAALVSYVSRWRGERELLGQEQSLLFVRVDGQLLHPDTITAYFHRHVRDAGLPRIRLHDVRRSYATAALRAGVSPRVVSDRLGHASVAFTLQVYSHVLPGMDRAAADQVADLILGAAAGEDGDTPL